MTSRTDLSRRRFLNLAVLAGAAPAIVALGLTPAAAADAALPHLSPTDPTAASLGYVENAAKLDAKKEPTYVAGSHCGSCALYQGKDGEAYGPCAIFAGKVVNAKGWCKSYAKKAG